MKFKRIEIKNKLIKKFLIIFNENEITRPKIQYCGKNNYK